MAQKIEKTKKLNSFSSSINNDKKENSNNINKMSISSCAFVPNVI